jgi:hypothetical protein
MDRTQVLALAPDTSAAHAAEGVRSWVMTGSSTTAIWGECQGSGGKPYRTAVDLSGLAYKCSCPSRKIPCKHALSLLLLHADGTLPAATSLKNGEPPDWVATWLRDRAHRAERPAAEGQNPDPEAARKRAEQRAERVASGMDELDQWLRDQVRQGLAAIPKAGYRHWDNIAARMVDAQASAVAERLRSLAGTPLSGPGWEGRLLEELAMLRLLAVAYRKRDELPPALRDTVRSRIGFTTRQAEVVAGTENRLHDVWDVLGWRDTEQERIRSRRIWLSGRSTGRPALVLSFAAYGESLDTSLIPGTAVTGSLAFYPAAIPLRAVIADRAPEPADPATPVGGTVAELPDIIADALARDPWLESWPAVLTDVTPARDPVPCLVDSRGDALPLHPAHNCWSLLALSGGSPLTVAAEWTPRGVRPLTAWPATAQPVVLPD